MKNTKHSKRRLQQRAINPLMQILVDTIGVEYHISNGVISNEMLKDEKFIHQLHRDCKVLIKHAKLVLKKLDGRNPIYQVSDEDGTVITVAYAYRKVNLRGNKHGGGL